MTDEPKQEQNTGNAAGALIENDEDVSDVLLDANEDMDPELLELKNKIEEEKRKTMHHVREKTVDLQARLTKQIAEMAFEQVKAEVPFEINSVAASAEAEELAKETGETEENSLAQEVMEVVYDNAVEERWTQYVNDVKTTIEEEKHPVPPIEPHIGVTGIQSQSDPFSQKPTEQSGKISFVQTVPKLQLKIETKLVKTPIYDLLLEKCNLHKALVQEYELKKLLCEHEKALKDK